MVLLFCGLIATMKLVSYAHVYNDIRRDFCMHRTSKLLMIIRVHFIVVSNSDRKRTDAATPNATPSTEKRPMDPRPTVSRNHCLDCTTADVLSMTLADALCCFRFVLFPCRAHILLSAFLPAISTHSQGLRSAVLCATFRRVFTSFSVFQKAFCYSARP